MDGPTSRTGNGPFSLQGRLRAYGIKFLDDGSTANQRSAAYGLYEVGTTHSAEQENVLNYTIWMTRLDMAHAVEFHTLPDGGRSSPTGASWDWTAPSAHNVIPSPMEKPVRPNQLTPSQLINRQFLCPTGCRSLFISRISPEVHISK